MATKKQVDGSLKIDVIGLSELQRELRKLDKELPKQLKDANKKAAELVAKDARTNYEGLPGLGKRAASALKVSAQQRESSIVIGKGIVRGAIILGVEFGGSSNPKSKTSAGGHTTQFLPHKGKEGYGVYPAIRKNREKVIEIYGDLVDQVAHGAFPN